uniref:uncharacterized protein LOC109963373 n=1 Tax=Monopterus albus TaxID=43700 RepID=UPI0009B3F653|nr:uncharacterized protein LOC109963373 [Monopterus albus]
MNLSRTPVESTETLETNRSGTPVESIEILETNRSGTPVESTETSETGRSGTPVESIETLETGRSGTPVESIEILETNRSGTPVESIEILETGRSGPTEINHYATPEDDTVSIPPISQKVYSSVSPSISTSSATKDRSTCSSVVQITATEAQETTSPVSEGVSLTSEEEKMLRREFVTLAVDKLFSRIFRKAKIQSPMPHHNILVQQVFDKTLALVECEKFDYTAKTLKHLDKTVYKDLCKNFSSAEVVLRELFYNETQVSDFIASLLRNHLISPNSPKKGGSIRRFFSSVRKFICKPFRQ